MDLLRLIQDRRHSGGRPLLFAHRGLRTKAPENSLPAFAAALDAGIDGVELDTHLTRDGEVAVLHDSVLTLIAPRRRFVPVSQVTAAELKTLDAGAYFDPAFAGTRIPTLREALALAKGRLLVDIELKGGGFRGRRLARAVARVVREEEMERQVFITSFDPLTLQAFHAAAPDIPTGLLYKRNLPADMGVRLWGRVAGAAILMPEKRIVTMERVAWLRGRSQGVISWVVNNQALAVSLAEMGVDALITDEAEKLRDTLI